MGRRKNRPPKEGAKGSFTKHPQLSRFRALDVPNMKNILNESQLNNGQDKDLKKHRTKKRTKGRARNAKTVIEIYREKKILSDSIAWKYDAVDQRKACLMRDCAKILKIGTNRLTGKKTIIKTNYCKLRLCPVCSYRKSRIEGFRAAKVVHKIITGHEDEYTTLVLGLTTRNCSAENLKETIKMQQKGFKSLIHKSGQGRGGPLSDIILGYIRTSEVTTALHLMDKGMGYHPHIHALVIVPRWYANKICETDETLNAEIEHLSELYRHTCKLDYTPEIDIRETYNTIEYAAKEIIKYTLKTIDIQSVEILRTYDRELSNLRMIEYGGLIRETYKDILEKEKTEKLSKKEAMEILIANGDLLIELLRWNHGAKLYDLIKVQDTQEAGEIIDHMVINSLGTGE
jgi:plasmid rolling circle replication initiator protein Rep